MSLSSSRLSWAYVCALLLAAPAVSAWARGGAAAPLAAKARVPSVSGLHVAEAQRRLERAGFRVGRIEEFTPERTLALFQVRGVIGYVFSQRPKPGVMHRTDRPVDLRMTAVRDGVRLGVPARRAPPPPQAPPPEVPPARDPPAQPPTSLPPTSLPPASSPPTSSPPTSSPPTSSPPTSSPPTSSPPEGALPTSGAPVPGPASSGDVHPRDASPLEGPHEEAPPPTEYAEGSPEAPRAAPPGNTDVVPTLLGLSLSDAEQLCTEAGMRLHVDRVAGHPIGRVLEQSPSAGGRRPAGGLVQVVVTAGGDFETDQAPIAPDVYLTKIAVPGLLDRTRLQAMRIIEDLGLRVREEKARRGLPGRVVDQMPPAGGRVPRGGVVRIWIGPPDPEAAPAPGPGAADPQSESPQPSSPGGNGTEPEVPAPKAPLPPGPLAAGVPDPLSPGHGTVLPKDASLPIGFTWRGVKGAEAYILEIEEEAAEGRWMANARKPSRKTAVILEVERLNSRSSGRLRWRVTAVSNGRQGTPSKWVILK